MVALLRLIVNYGLWILAACLIGVLYYLRVFIKARGEKARAIFALEKEIATEKAHRAILAMGGLVATIGLVSFLTFFVTLPPAPNPGDTVTPDLALIVSPTDTPPPPTFTPRPPTPTPLRPATHTPPPPPTPVPTPPSPVVTPAPATCPDPLARITSPGVNAHLQGTIQIQGTATHEDFWYYKIEYGPGDEPPTWTVIGDLHYEPVVDGVLAAWNVDPFLAGVYTLRLTVVDKTGNYSEPRCKVRVTIGQ